MSLPRHAAAPIVGLALLAGCIADVSGAPCTTSSTCPDSQVCVSGHCIVSASGLGGSGGSGGSGGAGGGHIGGGAGGGGAGGGDGSTSCRGCITASTCGAGLDCGQRFCDGMSACYDPLASTTCTLIDNVACPASATFQACTSDAECKTEARCKFNHCLVKCTVNTDCFIPNAAFSGFLEAYCVSSPLTDDYRCYPGCTSATDPICTGNTSCLKFDDDTYGFCRPH